MSRYWLCWFASLLFILTPSLAKAESQVERYDHFDVELMTVGPGQLYWERFGHNAILVRDRESGQGVTYNFGMFDFQQDNFLLNFARGLMTYRAVKYRADADIQSYVGAGRAVWIQRLNLTQAQKNRLIDHLNWHTEEGNQEYRYHYFDANCSTKVRDALDLAVTGKLSERFSQQPSSQSRRQFVRQLSFAQPWLFFSTLTALGRPVDQQHSRWDDFFVPMELRQSLSEFGANPADPSVPLVASTQRLFGTEFVAPAPANRWPTALLFGLLLATAIALAHRSKPLAWIPYFWLFLSGIVGFGLTGLWLLTNHDAAHFNENILLLSPLALIAGLAVWRRMPSGPWLILVLLATALLMIALKLTGFLYQDNREVIAIAAPAQLASYWWVRQLFAKRVVESA